nr:MAG TPA: hypothetical protein [Bacteriophage sp.]
MRVAGVPVHVRRGRPDLRRNDGVPEKERRPDPGRTS